MSFPENICELVRLYINRKQKKQKNKKKKERKILLRNKKESCSSNSISARKPDYVHTFFTLTLTIYVLYALRNYLGNITECTVT